MPVHSKLQTLIAFVAVPWNAFMAAFLYYAALAAVALSGTDPGAAVVATAYAAPPAMYGATLAVRLLRAVTVAFLVNAVKRPGVLPIGA